MSAPSGGDGPRKTPHWHLEWKRKKGPTWFGLRRATQTDIRVSLQGLRTLSGAILGLGLMVLIANGQWANRVEHAINTVDKKLPDWNNKSKDPEK